MYIAFGVVAFFVYTAFVLGMYQYLHNGIEIDWLTFVTSLFWPLVIVLVLVMRTVSWLANKAEQIVAVCYGNF